MSLANRRRLSIDPLGNWRPHTSALPDNCVVLGTVTLGDGNTGALVRMLPSGAYVHVQAGVRRWLDRREVAAALREALHGDDAGASPVAVRVDLELDAHCMQVATTLGSGDAAAGIRRALKLVG